MSTLVDQQGLYGTMKTLFFGNGIKGGLDYLLVDTIGGITYWASNNEEWGPIVAMDDINKLALNTHFYEMDDMAYPDSDYAIVRDDGILKPKFEVNK